MNDQISSKVMRRFRDGDSGAVRELYDLDLADELGAIGVATQEWALAGRNGRDVWSEPRGLAAGYRWPQFSLHRGRLQMVLYDAVRERLGPEAVVTGHRLSHFERGLMGRRTTPSAGAGNTPPQKLVHGSSSQFDGDFATVRKSHAKALSCTSH